MRPDGPAMERRKASAGPPGHGVPSCASVEVGPTGVRCMPAWCFGVEMCCVAPKLSEPGTGAPRESRPPVSEPAAGAHPRQQSSPRSLASVVIGQPARTPSAFRVRIPDCPAPAGSSNILQLIGNAPVQGGGGTGVHPHAEPSQVRAIGAHRAHGGDSIFEGKRAACGLRAAPRSGSCC